MVERFVSNNLPRAGLIKKRINAAFKENPSLRYKDLAAYCRVTPQAVSKWVKTGEIARDRIPKVAAFFGRRPDWLLDDLSEVAETLPKSPHNGTLNAQDREVLTLLHSLPDDVRAQALIFLRALHHSITRSK